MQTVDAVWTRLQEDPAHWVETKVTIAGTDYQGEELIFLKTEGSIFPGEDPVAGSCCIREINLEIRMPDAVIPRQAKIEPWVRLANGKEVSSWIPKGKFYIDTRDDDGENLILHGYDDLRRSEADCPIDGLDWPAFDTWVVARIARELGVKIDPRTEAIMDRGEPGKPAQGYLVQLPADYSSREVLAGIAAMYGGSFIMSDEGKLLLVTMLIPPETNYLIDHNGRAITFGGVKIIV